MGKIHNFIVITIFGCLLISTSKLIANEQQRKDFISTICSIYCGDPNSQKSQERLVFFLSKLHERDDAAFEQLFNYVVNKKGLLNNELSKNLAYKKLIDEDGSPNEKLTQMFQLIKQIIDNYNYENESPCWYRTLCETFGIHQLIFTVTNVSKIITAIAKNTEQPQQIDALLNKLSRQKFKQETLL